MAVRSYAISSIFVLNLTEKRMKYMKVVIAVDYFKGSLTSLEAGSIGKDAIACNANRKIGGRL